MQTQTGPKMAVKLVVLFLLIAAVQRTDGACNFPGTLTGGWTSSRWGDVTFTSTQLAVTGLTDIGSITFECEINSGSIYVLRSTTTVSVLGNTVDIVTCLDLTSVSSSSYMYYHATSEVSFLSGDTEPVKLVSPSSTVTTASACDVTSPYHTGTNHMFVLTGSETSAAAQCPNPLLGTFDNYTIDLGSGAVCNNVGYLTACNDRKNVSIDYSVCASLVFYSSEGNLECLYSSSNGSTYYVNLYNFDASVDDSATYRFTCVAIEYGTGALGDYVYATQFPSSCHTGQTATSVNAGGGTLLMSANVTCIPSSAASSSSIGIIIAIIILLLIIILVALAVYHLWYRKRWPVVKEKLPCLKGRNKGQVDPQIDEEDVKPSSAPADARPFSAAQPTVVATAVMTQEDAKRLQSSQSSRSVATPSKLQPEMGGENGNPASLTTTETSANPTPRRLPPLETAQTGETVREGIELGSVPIEPVYLKQLRAAPLETSNRFSEESESSDAVSIPPRLPSIHEKVHEPVYQNM